METLIIHKGNKGHFAGIQRSDSCISIGRSYHNDLVLADPYVAPEQVVISKHDSCWILQVLDHTNPVLVNGEAVDSTVEVRSGDVITVGRTRLPLYSASEPLEETRKLLFSEWFLQHAKKPLYSLLALSLICILFFTSLYLEQVKVMDWKNGGLALFALISFILVWSGFWSLIGKLALHKGNFTSQLFVTSLIAGLSMTVEPLAEYGEYAANSAVVGLGLDHLVSFIVLALLFKLNLMFATNIKRSSLSASLLALLFLGSTLSIDYFQQDSFSTSPNYLKTIKPHFAKWQQNKTMESYFADVQQVVEAD
jgi:hypothetical protein